MGIFNNFDSIIDLLGNSSNQDMETITQKIGLDKGKAGAIIGMGLPMILEAMNKNNQNPEGLESFSNAVKDHAQKDEDYNSVSEYVEKVDEDEGDRMLGHVFSDQKEGIIERIANTIGVEPAAVKRVLILMAPLVLKQIAGNAKNKDLDNEGIQRETQVIKDQVEGKLKQVNPNQVPQGQGGNMLEDILGGLLGQVGQQQTQQQQGGGLFDILKNMLG